jgi:hypothetical protein
LTQFIEQTLRWQQANSNFWASNSTLSKNGIHSLPVYKSGMGEVGRGQYTGQPVHEITAKKDRIAGNRVPKVVG